MAPKRPAAAAAGSASDASDAEADAPHHHHHPPSDTDPSKTPPPNPNPKSSAAAAAAAAPSAPADSAPARSDSGGSDSDSDAPARRTRPAPAPSPKQGKPRPRSPGINSDSYDSHAAAGFDSDLDPAAGADSDSDLSPPRPAARHNPRAEAAIVKPISSRPMDPPRRGGAKRPRSAAVPAPPPQPPSSEKRPARLWSPDDELVILRGLATYRAKSGVLPGSTNDIGKLHGHIRAQLSVKVSTTQLSDKVRRLKQKYQLLATRARSGRDQELHTPHDRSIYEHAKKVWGTRTGTAGDDDYDIAADSEELPATENSDDDDGMDSGRDDRYRIKNRKLMPIAMANGHSIQRRPAVPPNSRTKTEFEKGKDAYPYLWETVEELAREHPSGAAFKKAFEVLEGSKAQVMEEKLRKFRLTEIRQQLRRMDLMKDTVRMVLDALERAD